MKGLKKNPDECLTYTSLWSSIHFLPLIFVVVEIIQNFCFFLIKKIGRISYKWEESDNKLQKKKVKLVLMSWSEAE